MIDLLFARQWPRTSKEDIFAPVFLNNIILLIRPLILWEWTWLSGTLADLGNLKGMLNKCNERESIGIWLCCKKSRDEFFTELDGCDTNENKILSVIGLVEYRVTELSSVSQICYSCRNDFVRISNQHKLSQLHLPVYSHAEGAS